MSRSWAQAFCQKCGKDRSGKVSGLIWTRGDSVRLRTASTPWKGPVKYGPHGELFFFVIKKEKGQVVASNEVLPNPLCLRGNAFGMCTDWFAPAGGRCKPGSSASQSPDLWDMWRYGYPDWDGSVGSHLVDHFQLVLPERTLQLLGHATRHCGPPDARRHEEIRLPKKPWLGQRRLSHGLKAKALFRSVRTQRGKPCSECCGARPVGRNDVSLPGRLGNL